MEAPADALQLGLEDLAHPPRMFYQALLHDHADVGQRGRRAERVARMGRGHRAGRIHVHDRLAADDGRQRHAAGDPLAAADQVRRHPVVLESPELARAAEAGLHLVEDQEGLLPVAPGAELLDVFRRGEAGVAPLIGLAHHAGDRLRLDALGLQGLQEAFETGVGHAEAVGEGHLDEVLVEVDDPLLEGRNAAGQLGAEGAAVEGVLVGHDRDLAVPGELASPGPCQLDRAFAGLGAGGEQEDLFQPLRRHARQALGQSAANLRRKTVVVNQAVLDLVEDGLADAGMAVPGIGHHDAGGPVQPGVAPAVVDLDAFGPVPHHGRLAAHGDAARSAAGFPGCRSTRGRGFP